MTTNKTIILERKGKFFTADSYRNQVYDSVAGTLSEDIVMERYDGMIYQIDQMLAESDKEYIFGTIDKVPTRCFYLKNYDKVLAPEDKIGRGFCESLIR